jgi:hypothetical protein
MKKMKVNLVLISLIFLTLISNGKCNCQEKETNPECVNTISSYLSSFNTVDEINEEINNMLTVKINIKKIRNELKILENVTLERLDNYNMLKNKLDTLLTNYDSIINQIQDIKLNQNTNIGRFQKNRLIVLELLHKKTVIINKIRKIQNDNNFENYVTYIIEQYNNKINKVEALEHSDINLMTNELIEYKKQKIAEIESNLNIVIHKLEGLYNKRDAIET